MGLPSFTRPVGMEFVDIDGADAMLPLLELEHREFESVLGQPVKFSAESATDDHVWQVRIDPQISQVELRSDPMPPRLVSVVPRGEDLGQSLNLLHALAHTDQEVLGFAELESYQDVVTRIRTMIANVYPYFDLRGLDWTQICTRYEDIAELPADQFWTQAQRWVAHLGDAHTTIVNPGKVHHPPYIAEMTTRGATLRRVPHTSAAYRAGVRPGWVMHVENPDHWLAITGASAQHHQLVAGRRFMQIRTLSRWFMATSPAGHQIEWEERPEASLPSVTVTDSGVRISRFDSETPGLLAHQLRERRSDSEMTIDLRANVGGSVVAADQCRRMLIRRPGEYGKMRYSDGRAGLSPFYPLRLEPIRAGFTGNVRIVVDSMTYSAAEDFLQPLVGLDYVSVEGGPTGGGSGRPVTLPLMDGYSLRASTAITYTENGNPVEYFGISSSD